MMFETQMQKYLKKMFETQSVNDVYAVFEELITEIRTAMTATKIQE